MRHCRINLPSRCCRLISRVAHRAGSALELPWLGACGTMVLTSYLGQEAGRPMARVLFGDVNPSGKLTYSWPKRYADTPTGCFGERAYNATNSVYLEGVYVGYRWYEKRGIPVDFPFGHGLSYTSWKYGECKVSGEEGWKVSVDVTNVGERDGAEVVQLYVSAKEPKVDRPIKELKGFEKVFLAKGETKTVDFVLTPRDLALVNPPAIEVATNRRVRRTFPPWIKLVRRKGGEVAYYQGIPCQPLADAIRTCKGAVMAERLADGVRKAERNGELRLGEAEQLLKEIGA